MTKKRKRVYISGKISGLHYKVAYGAFEQAEIYFLSLNYEIVNPMKLTHNHDKSWESYMREDLKAMMDCDCIAFLNNYHLSRGAGIEKELAIELGFKVFEQNTEADIEKNGKVTFNRIKL